MGLSDFPDQKGKFCLLSNIRNYLWVHDICFTEDWLGGILGCWGFYYASPGSGTNEVLHGRNGSFYDIFNKLQIRLPISLTKTVLDAECDVLDQLKKLQSRSNPLIVWVDSFFLGYSLHYLKDHCKCLVLLLQIDENEVIIFDNGMHKADKGQFLQATDMEEIYFCDFIEKNDLYWKTNGAQAIVKGLQDIVFGLTDIVAKNNGFYGFRGMEQFVLDLAACSDLGIFYDYYFSLSKPGGLYLSRTSISRLCKEIGIKWGGLYTGQIVDQYGDLAEQWRKAANLLFKLSVSGDCDLRNRIVVRINKIIELEKKCMKTLSGLSEQLNAIFYKEISQK